MTRSWNRFFLRFLNRDCAKNYRYVRFCHYAHVILHIAMPWKKHHEQGQQFKKRTRQASLSWELVICSGSRGSCTEWCDSSLSLVTVSESTGSFSVLCWRLFLPVGGDFVTLADAFFVGGIDCVRINLFLTSWFWAEKLVTFGCEAISFLFIFHWSGHKYLLFISTFRPRAVKY